MLTSSVAKSASETPRAGFVEAIATLQENSHAGSGVEKNTNTENFTATRKTPRKIIEERQMYNDCRIPLFCDRNPMQYRFRKCSKLHLLVT